MAIGIALAAFGVAGIDEEDGKYKLRVGDVYVDISDIFGTQGIFVGIAAFSSIKSGDIWSAMGNVLDTMFWIVHLPTCLIRSDIVRRSVTG